MSLKDRIANDTYRVFLRSTDFADTLKIGTNSANAVTVVASLQANEVDNNSGSGISLQSFSHVLYAAYPIGGTITLNSSPYGLPFYQALGFLSTDQEQTVNGIRFTPMEYRPNPRYFSQQAGH